MRNLAGDFNHEKMHVQDHGKVIQISGKHDEHLKLLEEKFGVQVIARGDEITIVGHGEAVKTVSNVLKNMMKLINDGTVISQSDVNYLVNVAQNKESIDISDFSGDVVQITYGGRQIRPRTKGQKNYVDAIRRTNMVFGIGPAGTGKTYLAMALAIAELRKKTVDRLILTRPAVEAGERLGFLPGDMQDKVDPYLRPLYDALYDILGVETYSKYIQKDIIEIAPLAYMRGRTLDNSFIVLDEAQNTTPEQMKMFLTRMGFGSKVVVTGDITQIDLPSGKRSGLMEVQKVLKSADEISFVYLTEKDVVRHPLVQRVIAAYEKHENCKQ